MRLGRKGVLQTVGPAFLIAWGIISFTSSPALLIFGRFLAGFGCGASSVGATS